MMRILIVDDHAIVRRGLRELLSDEFHRVAFGEASDAQQALEQLRKKEWDVALLDIALPGKSGLDLLKDLKTEWPKLPILILSAHPEDQFAVRALKAGAGGYMTKESAPEELAKALRKIMAGGRYVSPALAEMLALGVTRISRSRRIRRSPTASMKSCPVSPRERPLRKSPKSCHLAQKPSVPIAPGSWKSSASRIVRQSSST